MTTLQEALPCPFCGKQHTLQVISGQELMDENQEFWQHSESFGMVCDASTPDGKGGCGAMGGFKPTEEEAIEAWNRRTALAQHREQQPVCHGCGIPAGDVHMSTCKSGKWPSRVSNGDTAAPAPQPAQEPVKFLVNGTRFKLSFDTRGRVSSLWNFMDKLDGRWVALVAAENDCHLQSTALSVTAAGEREAGFTTGHCKEHAKPGGCQLHNLQCGYPACDRRAV